MRYIAQSDYDYITNKYHDASKPFNAFSRFIRRDELFSADSGMAPEMIIAALEENDKQIESLPHPIRKARAIEYVLKNTRIACDPRDIFPAINMVDNPFSKLLVEKWKGEVFDVIAPEVGKKRQHLRASGIVSISPDYAHSVPNWDRLLELGFSGILAESEAARREKDLTPEQEAFFEGIKITYEAVIFFIGRLEAQARKTPGSERLADALASIKKEAPRTFYEALLVNYLFFMISEHVDSMQARSSGNFDRLFYRYYKNDLANGVSEEQIRADLAYFFLQFTAIGNYWGQPVYLGGEKADGSTQINELSYLFLDVYDQMGIYNPKVQIKVCRSMPRDILMKALDMIRRGKNSIVFVSDHKIRASLEKAGFSAEEARLADIKGCYEYSAPCSIATGATSYLNLMKPLEYALHEGKDGVTGIFSGSSSPSADSYASFEEFYQEYKRHLSLVIESVIEVVGGFEGYLDYMSPQPLLSATFPSCIQKGDDALKSGSVHNDDNMMFGFLADAADSLTNIKKYVFDKKELTLAELRDILDSNFEGNEALLHKLRADRDKYGNNKELPDFFAKDIAEYVCSIVCGRDNSPKRAGKWNLGFHVARYSYIYADKTASSPNGRLLGEELSKNVSPSMGMNREGATAAILSATKIDATAFTNDACLDLGLLPGSISGEDGLEAMYGLLMTFINRGGHAIHINVFDAQTLRDAQKNPEKYQDLQIRVCGWNVLWNNINKKEQDGFIRQAEALV